MNPAVKSMLDKYELRSSDDHVNALREIFQEIALCGLWRAKFFEHAAFYGGTALRVLHGLDRFSEDMDFSLIAPDENFDLFPYCKAIQEELESWGFKTTVEVKEKTADSAVESAFLKADTREQLLVIEADEDIAGAIHAGQRLKIKIEVDTDPPPLFETEARFLLLPLPFSVRVYTLPSLFAGKMHALLCRTWRNNVKGRDWYDLVWYVAGNTPLNLNHLGARMRQSGHLAESEILDAEGFQRRLHEKIETLNVALAANNVRRFLSNPATIKVWSKEFFHAVASRVTMDQR